MEFCKDCKHIRLAEMWLEDDGQPTDNAYAYAKCGHPSAENPPQYNPVSGEGGTTPRPNYCEVMRIGRAKPGVHCGDNACHFEEKEEGAA